MITTLLIYGLPWLLGVFLCATGNWMGLWPAVIGFLGLLDTVWHIRLRLNDGCNWKQALR